MNNNNINNINDESKNKLNQPEEEPDPKLFRRLIIPRKTFTKNNCLRFKEVLDKNIETKRNIFISATKIGMNVNTLHQRLNEALLYLIEMCDTTFPECKYKSIDYIQYRSRIKFVRVGRGDEEGVMIDWHSQNKILKRKPSNQGKQNLINEAVSELDGASKFLSSSFTWKERVVQFIETDEMTTLNIDRPEEFGGVYLNDLDIDWLKKTFESAGIEYELKPQLIRAIK